MVRIEKCSTCGVVAAVWGEPGRCVKRECQAADEPEVPAAWRRERGPDGRYLPAGRAA